MLHKAKEEIARQKETMVSELKHDIGSLVVAATAKIIGKQIDEKTQDRLIREAVEEVRQ